MKILSQSNLVAIPTDSREINFYFHFHKIYFQFTIVGFRELSRACRFLPTVSHMIATAPHPV